MDWKKPIEPGTSRRGVQFVIDDAVWEKFNQLCRLGDGENHPMTQGERVAYLIWSDVSQTGSVE